MNVPMQQKFRLCRKFITDKYSNADFNAAKNILSKGIALGRQRESLDCALTLEPNSIYG